MRTLIVGASQYRRRLNHLEAVGFDFKQTLSPDVSRAELFRSWSALQGAPADLLQRAAEALEVDSGVGRIAPAEAFAQVWRDVGRPLSTAEEPVWYEQFTQLRLRQLAPYDGADALLEWLRTGGLVTGGLTILGFLSYEAARRLLEPRLDVVLYSVDTQIAAKDKRAFRLLTDRLGAQLMHTMFADDRLEWTQAAKQSGLLPVLVLHPEGDSPPGSIDRSALAESGVVTIDTVTEVAGLLG